MEGNILIVDSWKKVKLVCGNHGEDVSKEMQIKEYLGSVNDTVFYNCPDFKSIYADKKDLDGIRSCNNRLSISDFTKMLKKLTDLADDGAEETNLTGYKWEDRGIEYKVLEHKHGKFTVRVLNKKAISR